MSKVTKDYLIDWVLGIVFLLPTSVVVFRPEKMSLISDNTINTALFIGTAYTVVIFCHFLLFGLRKMRKQS